jgi:TRAP transporter TAXI family solute receptor
MYNKFSRLVVLIILIAIVLISGKSMVAAGELTEAKTVVFSANSVGNSAYAVAVGMGQLLEDNFPSGSLIDVQPTSPGAFGCAYSFEADASSPADITIATAGPVRISIDTGTLGKPPAKNVAALVGALNQQHVFFVMKADFVKKHDIKSVEDAISRKVPIRIGCSPVGSVDEFMANAVMAQAGYTYDDLKSWGGDVGFGAGAQLADFFRDGRLDMIIDMTNKDSASMAEIDLTNEVNFMPVGEKTEQAFVDLYGCERSILPAGTWKNQAEDLHTIGWPDGLFCRADLDEDVAYAITKIVCENAKKLAESFASLNRLNPEGAWKPEVTAGVPLHPGAQKYYQDKGYMPK